jgi:hypothetical protein
MPGERRAAGASANLPNQGDRHVVLASPLDLIATARRQKFGRGFVAHAGGYRLYAYQRLV